MQQVGPGVRLGFYDIVAPIGKGGMGEVYLARDTRLGRDVAIKLLRAGNAADAESRRRLVREARLAARLNHPGIVTIYEVSADTETCFIAMEYVRGRSLRQAIKESRPPLPQALAWALQICEALAHAHESGIVHRDIKTANVMITADGNAKVLDFGLARPAPGTLSPDADPLTMPGMVLGTPGYLSPEQAAGEPLTAATDVFSFGVVAYEMISGAPCFSGASPADVMRKVMVAEPDGWAQVSSRLTPGLAAVLAKCLHKDPSKRYADCTQAARDLRRASSGVLPATTADTASLTTFPSFLLNRPRSARFWIVIALVLMVLVVGAFLYRSRYPGIPEQRGLAVLPFTVIQSDERAHAFSLGLVMAVATNLSELATFQRTFWVVPASDVIDSKAKSIREAQQLFGVQLVLTGSIETGGDRVRITTTLSDAASQRQLRSRQITVASTDSFLLQDRVVQVVGDLLELELPEAERATARSGGSTEPGAGDYYLQGQGYIQTGVEKADSAIEVLREALKRDQKFAAAHAALGEAYLLKYAATMDPSWIALAKQAAGDALELRGRTPQSLQTLGLIARTEGRYAEAVTLFRDAVDQEPHNIQAWIKLGQAYESAQQPADAQSAYERAIAVQPGFPGGHTRLGVFFYRIGRYQQAAKSFERARDLAPDSYRTWAQLGALYIQLGRYADAESLLKRSIALHPTSMAYNNLSSCYFYQERFDDAVPMMEKAYELGNKSLTVIANLARAYRLHSWLSYKAGPAYERAFELANSMLAVNPRDADTQAEIAWMHAERGEREQARRALAKAMALAPNSGAVLMRAVLTHEILGDREQALLAYKLLGATGSYRAEINRRPELKAFRADPRVKGELWKEPQQQR